MISSWDSDPLPSSLAVGRNQFLSATGLRPLLSCFAIGREQGSPRSHSQVLALWPPHLSKRGCPSHRPLSHFESLTSSSKGSQRKLPACKGLVDQSVYLGVNCAISHKLITGVTPYTQIPPMPNMRAELEDKRHWGYEMPQMGEHVGGAKGVKGFP